MAYIRSLLAHFRVVADWAARAHATAELDVRSFELELRCRGRYWQFAPQFVSVVQGRFANEPLLTADAVGFSGWLPYRPRPWALAADKLGFKGWLQAHRLRTPPWWEAQAGYRPECSFVLKGSPGAFGAEVLGPWRAGEPVPQRPAGDGRRWYVEAFVEGRIAKVWYWGGRACFAHVDPMPRLRGDGLRSARELVLERLALAGRAGDGVPAAVEACLASQGLALDAIPPRGATPYMDFRYGRRYEPQPARLVSDDALPALPAAVREQVDAFGALAAELRQQELAGPVLFAADAVLDEQGRLWWLELNAHPAVPPEAYPPMLADLFGFEPEVPPVSAAASAAPA